MDLRLALREYFRCFSKRAILTATDEHPDTDQPRFEMTQTVAHPLARTARVSGGFLLHHVTQRGLEVRNFFSNGFRPPPTVRMRSGDNRLTHRLVPDVPGEWC
jgi:hypothetical protein